MAPKSEMVRRIKNLQGEMNQVEFARYLGVPQSRVSEYRAGKRPTAEMCVRLAKLAKYPDNLWFLEQAGLKRDDILSAADKIRGERNAPPVEGEVIRVPWYRETEQGRVETDCLMPLPNRPFGGGGQLICLQIDELSPDSIEVPLGIYVLDISVAGSRDLKACRNQDVLIRYSPETRATFPGGLYVGRICITDQGRSAIRMVATLEGRNPIWLGWHEEVLGAEAQNNEDLRVKQWEETWERVGPNFPLAKEIYIVGRILWRFPLLQKEPDSE